MVFVHFSLWLPLLFIWLLPFSETIYKSDHEPHNVVCLSEYEDALYKELNKYRNQHGLPSIALSASLTYVAQVHCRDLSENYSIEDTVCNMHSWSDKGSWTPCCYTNYHENRHCAINKPIELTSYKSEGYEIAFFSNYNYPDAAGFAKGAIDLWSKSKGHNETMLNLGMWKKLTWKACGVGIYGYYATIWFGTEPDDDTTIVKICK
ncbi:MAG: CAP domain-containing protein [Bacteroidales bacterium]